MHRFLSRSNESGDLTRRANRGPRKRTPCSTLRRPTKCNAVGAQSTPDDFVSAVKNLCIVRARVHRTIPALFLSLIFSSILPGFLRADSPFDGKIIQSIELQSDGPLNDISYTDLFNLLELRQGKSYSPSQAERSIQRLFSTHDPRVMKRAKRIIYLLDGHVEKDEA